MKNLWGKLKKDEVKSIQAGARKMTDSELDDRYLKKDGGVFFKILCRTERAQAGGLDIEKGEDAGVTEELPAPENEDYGEDSLNTEIAQEEEIDEKEILEIPLIAPDDFDHDPVLTEEDKKAEKEINKELSGFQSYFSSDKVSSPVTGETAPSGEGAASLPAEVDHRSSQSPVKNQGGRGTCVAHASCACMEAYGHINDDLSEQYLHYKFNEFLNRPHNANQGLVTTDSARYLARSDGRICEETDWPYEANQAVINQLVRNNSYAPPRDAMGNQDYGYRSYKIISDNGLTGESIKNTRYLEALLYQGYNIVMGTWVSWDDQDNNGVLDPVLDSNGNPVGRGGHAMLVVGYNRTQQYFIVKNSWGGGWGHSGYAYFHYNLARSCFKYGYVVKAVVPAEPQQVPRRLRYAPFSTRKISRARLRGCILGFKTSRGNYAICEAYAGYNLLLKNLKVYNSKGNLYLQRNSLIIRGTYLCDIDSGRETSYDADFWWEAVRPGVNYLVPRNNARACVLYDFARLSAAQISRLSLSRAPIENKYLRYGVIVGRTSANRRFKLVVNEKPGNSLSISYLVVYNPNGSRFRYKTNIVIPSSWTYNLDTLRLGGSYADIWWHVISSGVAFLEPYSSARIRLLWYL